MKKPGISQETLKLIACITMLLDHIGAVLVNGWFQYHPSVYSGGMMWLYYGLRMVGRISFPIYCFLLVEGAHHTKNPKKYALRLAVGALLAELPFDLAITGAANRHSNSVMLTLLLGFCMVMAMKRASGFWKGLVIVPFYFLAELLRTDYGGNGLVLIAMLAMTRGVRYEKLWQFAGFMLLFFDFTMWYIGTTPIPVNQCTLLAMIPIFCYNGEKHSYHKALQWGFYLFYPVHLLILWGIKMLLWG